MAFLAFLAVEVWVCAFFRCTFCLLLSVGLALVVTTFVFDVALEVCSTRFVPSFVSLELEPIEIQNWVFSGVCPWL